jgi:hypothetical protein
MSGTCSISGVIFEIFLYQNLKDGGNFGGSSMDEKILLQLILGKCRVVLRHELSSLARKPKSWVRIPHKVWMIGMCLFWVCVVLCLGRVFATSWSLIQGVLPSAKLSRNWKSEARAQGRCKASEKKNIRGNRTYIFGLDFSCWRYQ